MGLSSFWSTITAPRVKEIQPPKHGRKTTDQRPATSSGVRTDSSGVRTISAKDGGGAGLDLNAVNKRLSAHVTEPPKAALTPAEEKKARRRSRGLSLSRSKTEEGVRKRRSLFGGSGAAGNQEAPPAVPTLPTLDPIYSPQGRDRRDGRDGSGTAVNGSGPSPSSRRRHDAQVHELPPLAKPLAPRTEGTRADVEVKKQRRRSLGEVLTGKRSGAATYAALSGGKTAPPMPALPASQGRRSKPAEKATEGQPSRSRRNSNASVASKASKTSRKSRRKSWFQKGKGREEDVEALPPMPTSSATMSPSWAEINAQGKARRASRAVEPPNASTAKQDEDLDDSASIRTTRSEKSTARLVTVKQKAEKVKQRRQSSASQVRRKRRSSFWASSNPDYSDDEYEAMPPVPPLVGSASTISDLDSADKADGNDLQRARTHHSVRGDDTKAPRPLSTVSVKSRTYTPRSASKSFLVSTTPVSKSARETARHSLHACQDLDDGAEGAGFLTAEQQREWDKLKHLMAVMDARQDWEQGPGQGAGGEERRQGVKYSNQDALAALGVGLAR